jgi:hypothetical protein
MKTDKCKILLIVPPFRRDFYYYLEQSPNVDFYILYYVNEKEADDTPSLPAFIKGQYFWSHYKTPKELLEKIDPSKLIFFEIIDQRQISLIVTANHYNYNTFYLEHGAAGDRETARQRSESGKLNHVVFSRIPDITKRLTTSLNDALLSKKFYFYSLNLLRGSARKNYLQLPFLTLSYKLNKALMVCKFPERVPNKCILFNRVNFEEFQLYTGVTEENVSMEGVPFFDDFYSDRYGDSGPIVYIEHPLLEEGVCGWTAEHHKKIAFELFQCAEKYKEEVIVKLHPRSSLALWKSYKLQSDFFQIVQHGDFNQVYLNSKLILSYASTLVTGFLCAKKNVVLLGWHPKPHIFGHDFSKYGLSHLSLNINDLKSKFEYWTNNNQAVINENKHEAFLKEFNYPFDGKATERVIKTITEHEVH